MLRNRGELAEGWYDPKTLNKARDAGISRGPSEARSPSRASSHSRARPAVYEEYSRRTRSITPGDEVSRAGTHPHGSPGRPAYEDERLADGDEDSDTYGPQIPIEQYTLSESRESRRIDRSGPKVPTTQDLQLRRGTNGNTPPCPPLTSHPQYIYLTKTIPTAEAQLSSAQEARETQRLSHTQSLKSHKSELRHIADEITPRAEPGTRERRLEKRREAASSNRAFAESRRAASPGEAPDAELMGGEGDLDTLKSEREKEVRKKNEREIRKEEMLRARAAEREERLKSYRQKEEETISYLRALAKERFG
ncbi:predicted protein [Uncinocarpus reesii 1704]|uniref:Uncharacterized protein n=1 Tax=Uncinocarpus reesii (strain UAMH 1704) TaxID=336963 RepID=C4JYV1_UNCRE|nr:uncharacterized protein UREG_07352 [Uncinocarpus reesii 1704]EEP82487.1 predicted protein [Uncinocarpus reesii 1704]